MEDSHKLIVFLLLIVLGLTIYNTFVLHKHTKSTETKEGMMSPICSGYGFKNSKTMPFGNDSNLYDIKYNKSS